LKKVIPIQESTLKRENQFNKKLIGGRERRHLACNGAKRRRIADYQSL